MNKTEILKLQTGAAKGDAECQYELAMRHIYGNGVPEDNNLATVFLEKASSQGHIEATYNLGICHHYGFGTTVNLKTAYDLYLQSANAWVWKGNGANRKILLPGHLCGTGSSAG